MFTAKNLTSSFKRYLPPLSWLREYSSQVFVSDLVAAMLVTIMLIPQSLAYALLVGLPPEIGLYASMAPLLLYAVFGTSRALAVGPVAVASLMTAAAAAQIAQPGTPAYSGVVVALALLVGVLLLAMGLLRLGFLANFLSHPVISGFITAAAVQIAAGQVAPLLGIRASGESLWDLLLSMLPALDKTNPYTATLGLSAFLFLLWARNGLKQWLLKLGLAEKPADMLAKIAPALVIVLTSLSAWLLQLELKNVAVLGTIPQGLPQLALPGFSAELWGKLLPPALLICIVGYVESISVALTLAAKRRQRVDADQELVALGAANMASAISGAFPVTGALSRSVVNFNAGAVTPAAGAFTAAGVAVVSLFLTPALFFLPKAALAAIIISAVLSLVDLDAIKRTYAYSRTDFLSMVATIGVTWIEGVEIGLLVGVGLSIFFHLYRTSKPHVAVVGQIPGTRQFRNVERHDVVTDPEILSLRIDESLYFPNARFIEDLINDAVAANPDVRHVIIECPAINTIDTSALESLEAINRRLAGADIQLHLSEVKGPVMDRLQSSHFLLALSGRIHMSQFDAIASIKPELAHRVLNEKPAKVAN